jgi:hypothetical protein
MFCAIDAVSASVRKPIEGSASAMRHLGVACCLLREFQRFLKSRAILDQILAGASCQAFFCRECPSGQHHVLHQRNTDEPGNAHRSAAAQENAALPFG